jgi:CsoR family transcriptional regulator, copper-sensing transcriptional repressor
MPKENVVSLSETPEHKAKIVNRLKRLEGQVRGLQKMVDDERDCHEVLTLVSGIRSALNATGDIILATYLEKCQAELKQGEGNVDRLIEVVRLARG